MFKKWKFWGGGGDFREFPLWWGHGYFLELHNLEVFGFQEEGKLEKNKDLESSFISGQNFGFIIFVENHCVFTATGFVLFEVN